MSLIKDPDRILSGESRLPAVRETLGDEAAQLHWVIGPSGCGKTTELARFVGLRPTLFWEVGPVEGSALQGELERLINAVLGELPPPLLTPDPVRLRGDDAWWMMRFQQIFQALGTDAPGVWIIDGVQALRQAGRNVVDLLLEAWTLFGRPHVHLILASSSLPASVSQAGEGEGVIAMPGVPPIPMRVHVLDPQLPYREAAMLQGARGPSDALARWSIFGGHPPFLPRAWAAVEGGIETTVIGRVLSPAGDLFDAPLRALQARVQTPARYLAILAALAQGERRWGDIAKLTGVPAGNQLAPYLKRLEEEGWVRSVSPLDGRAGGRTRRYEITDPFLEFWMAHVFPKRSYLRQVGPARFYAECIHPVLPTVLHRGLERLALAYTERHARETLPARPRVVGSLWAEGVDIPVAARLANGQVCYGVVGPVDQPADESLFYDLERAMKGVRWGMGREARAPLFFLSGQAEEGLRRQVARNPLARILTPDQLFAMHTEGSE